MLFRRCEAAILRPEGTAPLSGVGGAKDAAVKSASRPAVVSAPAASCGKEERRGVPMESYVTSTVFSYRAFFAGGPLLLGVVRSGKGSKRPVLNFSGDAEARRLCRPPSRGGASARHPSFDSCDGLSSPALDRLDRLLFTPCFPSTPFISPPCTPTPTSLPPPRIPSPLSRPLSPPLVISGSSGVELRIFSRLLRRLLGLLLVFVSLLPRPPVSPPTRRMKASLRPVGFVVRPAV